MKTKIPQKTTLRDLAEWLGISPAFLCRIRSGGRGMSLSMSENLQMVSGVDIRILRAGTGSQIYNALLKAYRKVNR